MIRVTLLGIMSFFLMGEMAQGAGLSYNENFVVFADNQLMSDKIIKQADIHREVLSTRWLGKSLAQGQGRTTIHFRLDPTEEYGRTWRVNNTNYKTHTIWITGNDLNIDYLLKHELLHAVFATKYGDERFPEWIEEGIASRYDNGTKRLARVAAKKEIFRTGKWPSSKSLFGLNTINCENYIVYACLNGATDYLLNISKKDHAKLIRFGIDSKLGGIDKALNKYYNINNQEDFLKLVIKHMYDNREPK